MSAAAITSRILLKSRKDSRDHSSKPEEDASFGARQAYRVRAPPMHRMRKPRTNIPRAGSVANACTEVSTPERTRNVPSRLNEKPMMASSSVQLLKRPRFSVTASEWISAVPASQGMNEAFSTGSQNHQPPHPSSWYAHHEPSVTPSVRNAHAAVVHGRVQRAHAVSSRPESSALMANANATEKPT